MPARPSFTRARHLGAAAGPDQPGQREPSGGRHAPPRPFVVGRGRVSLFTLWRAGGVGGGGGCSFGWLPCTKAHLKLKYFPNIYTFQIFDDLPSLPSLQTLRVRAGGRRGSLAEGGLAHRALDVARGQCDHGAEREDRRQLLHPRRDVPHLAVSLGLACVYTLARSSMCLRMRKKSTEADPKACFENRVVNGY